MRILGIDPGLERMGYGLVDRIGSKVTPVAYGLIETPRIKLPDRLVLIHEQLSTLIAEHKPDQVATERLLFAMNKTSALDVSKALGVALMVCGKQGLPWVEYTPPEIKLSIVGTGRADKKQVEFMVVKLLNLAKAPKPDDVADALAIALTHALRNPR